MKYLNEEIEFEDLYFLRETLYQMVETLKNGVPTYQYYKSVEKLVMNLTGELNKDIREAEDSFVDNNICSVCGGEIIPQIAYRGRGTDPFDPNYWPDEYNMVCEDCGENYG